MRYARCAGECGRWLPETRVVALGCPACFYQTARCKDCGWIEGATRSLFSHWIYWSGSRGEQLGGHSKRLTDWATYTSALEKIKESRAAEAENVGKSSEAAKRGSTAF